MNMISTYFWPGETHFGVGAAALVGPTALTYKAASTFILADPGVVQAGLLNGITASLEEAGLAYTIYDQVVANPDIASVQAAAAAMRQSGAKLLVGVGGGSALDTAKAVKLMVGSPAEANVWEYALLLGDEKRAYPDAAALPPYIAIPTTAGTGAEVTPWAVLTQPEQQRKFSVGDRRTIPDVALLDPALTLTLPPHLTAATGMDALSHLIEAYVSTNHNPILDPMILYGISLVGRSLRMAVMRGSDLNARTDMLHASLIGGIAISSKWLGACHSLAHPLSAQANLHHGLACAIMLPGQMRYNLPAAMERYADVAAALDPSGTSGSTRKRANHAVKAVQRLIWDLEIPDSLSEAGVDQEMIPALAKAAMTDLNWWTNPRQVSEEVMERLYHQAFWGV